MMMSDNDKQHAYWNSDVAEKWVARLAHFERGLHGIHRALMTFAAPQPGENVLDIGCGAGTTTEEIAAIVAPGKVVGLDISRPLLEAARARTKGAIEFIEADATDYPFAPQFDLVFSRLGVMFFADPVLSFANIRRALKPGGRMAFLCWCPAREVAYLWQSYQAGLAYLPDYNPTPDNAPGPFGLADRARTEQILTAAGWRDVRIERCTPPSHLGDTLEEAVEQVMNMGPLARVVREAEDVAKDKIRAAIAPVLAPYQTAEGVIAPAACWLVEAWA